RLAEPKSARHAGSLGAIDHGRQSAALQRRFDRRSELLHTIIEVHQEMVTAGGYRGADFVSQQRADTTNPRPQRLGIVEARAQRAMGHPEARAIAQPVALQLEPRCGAERRPTIDQDAVVIEADARNAEPGRDPMAPRLGVADREVGLEGADRVDDRAEPRPLA